jgi:hypothetical protein
MYAERHPCPRGLAICIRVVVIERETAGGIDTMWCTNIWLPMETRIETRWMGENEIQVSPLQRHSEDEDECIEQAPLVTRRTR